VTAAAPPRQAPPTGIDPFVLWPRAVYAAKPPLERDQQHAIRRNAEAVGFTYRNLSQARPSKQSLGFPDIVLVHRPLGLFLFWETKTYEARPWRRGEAVLRQRSADQLAFAEDCAATRQLYGHGALTNFYQFLLGVRLAEMSASGAVILRARGAPPALQHYGRR
jgi:hypothetical protein